MVATKMFWDMWRNLTNATSNWTISSTSSSSSSSSWSSVASSSSFSSSSSSRSKSSRYNRLRSPPTKSYSQPTNLAGILETSSLESLNDNEINGGDNNANTSIGHNQQLKDGGGNSGGNANVGAGQQNINVTRAGGGFINKKSANKKQTIKHSFTTASFLPFSSFRAENECGGGTNKSRESKKDTQSTQAKGFVGNMARNVGRIPTSQQGGGGGGAGDEKSTSLPIMMTTSQTSGSGQQPTGQRKEDEYCVVEHVISDLDEDDDGDHLACDVCDRAFSTFRKLADHQRKKRHYGCVQCDTLFPNREGLDIHREQMCHYQFAIDLAGYRDYVDENDDSDSFITDDDENGFGYSDDGDDEEMERLL